MHINIHLNNETPSETTLPVSSTICPESTPRTTETPKEYLYFAYGSNLSPSQMKQRCIINPNLSGKPVAIAILPKWRWLICEAGYANVLPPAGLRVGAQKSDVASKIPISGSEDAVYGVLYKMDLQDEAILDGYEGVDCDAEDANGSAGVGVDIRPKEQGEGDYNKWYLPAKIVKWIHSESEGENEGEGQSGGSGEEVDVLVYVDEERVRLAPPKTEYIGRMNRAIRESVALGVNERWVEEVMRRFIPAPKVTV
ncbi:hypothetical protein N7478_009039 [Penicillium angulare]|uniref:uncharacterized protein n=1 Tax=Penicillium angulare TaxID=116970 RepID=UPI00253F8AAC|nr:uncharacterized protein N7478_009039 [Penicillium angulare]KAJ5273914.1 hypothetical protein N7478_009039 [Penicillium angulare]